MVDLITEKIGAVNSFVIPQRAENKTPKFQGDKNNSFEEKAKKIFPFGLIGRLCFKESFVSVSGNLYTVLAVVVSLFAMCLLPFFFALLFRDIGKTLAVPMILFFLMIFLMNGDQALFISRILPMGQLRLIALQQFTPSMVQFVFTDFLWIFILYFGAYLGFRHSDLK